MLRSRCQAAGSKICISDDLFFAKDDLALAFFICPLLGSDPWGFTHCPCMIYYTLVGVRADRTRTGGVTPARALLQ